MFFRMVYKSGQIFLPRVTDRQTDRRTDRILITIPRLHYMQRGKNDSKCGASFRCAAKKIFQWTPYSLNQASIHVH